MKRVAASLLFAGLVLLPCVAAEHGSESHGPDPTPWKWANFVVLCGGLGYLLYKKAGAFFRSRTDEIQRAIAESKKLKQEAQAKLAEAEQMLQGLTAEVERLRQRASTEMESESERLRRETEQELRKIQHLVEQEIASAAKAARQELKTYSADLALDLAERKIQGSLTPEVSDSLVASFLADLDRQASSGRPRQEPG